MATDDELAQTATAAAASGPTLPAPPKLGKYRLEGELGSGGMGVVHAAFDPDLERRVAIKLLRDAPGDVSRARLLREARAMARLAHPNVVTVYEVGTIDGRDFVAMELLEGKSLADWLRGEPRKRDEILDAFVAAGHGLAAAHAEGLVHRDFKPHNVLRSKRGRIAVTDFGLARGVDAQLAITRPIVGPIADGTPNLPLLTATGAVVGTPAYMAPEQWKGEAIGPATDQFAYCVALWEALAGKRPFAGETGDELRAAIERGTESLDASAIPRRFRGLLKRGLDPHPARRWASMDALLAAIARARRLPMVAIGTAALVVVVALAAIALAMRGGPTTPTAPAALPMGDHDALVASIHPLAEGRVEAPRATVDQIVANGQALFGKDARLVYAVAERDPVGYKLYAIKPGSIFAALGLENGDTLVAVDNIALSVANLPQIYASLHGADHATIDLHRRSLAKRLTVEIRD